MSGGLFDDHIVASSDHTLAFRDAAKLLQCTGQSPTTKNYLIRNVNSAIVEKP